jgi:transposase-like protein
MNQEPQSQQRTSKHLTTLFLMHAAGTRFGRKFCPACQKETQHGKTVRDKHWECLECLPSPVEGAPQA